MVFFERVNNPISIRIGYWEILSVQLEDHFILEVIIKEEMDI